MFDIGCAIKGELSGVEDDELDRNVPDFLGGSS
jgi:hypothetical protein